MERLISGRAQVLWARFFGSPAAAITTCICAALALFLGLTCIQWLVLDSVGFGGSEADCRAATGMCWPFIAEKTRFILFGTYPYDLHWRPALASTAIILLCVTTGLQIIGTLRAFALNVTIFMWFGLFAAVWILMGGGVLGLQEVDSSRWNGLPVLLILSIGAIALAFPLGLLLALARCQTNNKILRRFSYLYVEIMRSIPMITVLFVGVFVLPLLMPQGAALAPVSATLIALIFFHAAYFAEDWRAGISALDDGQAEASAALGLTYWQSIRLVIMPQAFIKALPSLLNSIIGAYKDTSLVVVLGIHDLVATAGMSFSDPSWRNYALEAYLLIGVWFLISCGFLAYIGRVLRGKA